MFQSHHKWFLPPTIGIRAPFVRKQKSFGVYLNFQSCQKQVLIIPQCRAHPYELTSARINLIGARDEPYAPPEDSAQTPTRPEVDDECRPRAPYSRRAEPCTPSPAEHKPLRTPGRAEPLPAASAPKEYSLEYSANIPQNIPGSTDTTKRLMSSPKCRSVEVINNPARPGSNHREVNCINYK